MNETSFNDLIQTSSLEKLQFEKFMGYHTARPISLLWAEGGGATAQKFIEAGDAAVVSRLTLLHGSFTQQ